MSGIKVKEIKIDDLKFTDMNPVKRSKRGRDTINRSLSELGPGRSVLIDEDNVLVAGNGTVEQAKELGITRVIEVELEDRNTLVAVKKPDMTEEEKYRMATFDNVSAKLAVYNPEGIAEILNKGYSFEGILSEKEIDKIILPDSKKSAPEIEYDDSGEEKFYVVIECDDKSSQDDIFGYLEEEGYKVMKYEGNKRG